MKALADYVHSKGLKFGIYSDAGTKTCQGRPGTKGYDEIDAKTYAEWGVDYLKYDWCSSEGQDTRDAYGRMSRALRNSGRPIVFSICEWGSTKPWLVGPGRRPPLAHDRRHPGLLGLRPRLGRDGRHPHHRPSWPTSTRTPAPGTGTTPTCWRSATAG